MYALTIFSPRTLSLNYRTMFLGSVATPSTIFTQACGCTWSRHSGSWWRVSEYYGGRWVLPYRWFLEFCRPACGSITSLLTKKYSQFRKLWSRQGNQRLKQRSLPGGGMQLWSAIVPRNRAVERTWERVRSVKSFQICCTSRA
jgi:hypothetical protein